VLPEADAAFGGVRASQTRAVQNEATKSAKNTKSNTQFDGPAEFNRTTCDPARVGRRAR
jgi:hypothetical protein